MLQPANCRSVLTVLPITVLPTMILPVHTGFCEVAAAYNAAKKRAIFLDNEADFG